MKLILLTTNTTHHLYFAWKLKEAYGISNIVLETNGSKSQAENSHPFEELRDIYEREVLLKGCTYGFSDLAETGYFDSINSADAILYIRERVPEIIVIFGTTKLSSALIESASLKCLNLHGGNPEYYRGLDSHLWAIYHNDFQNLTTTLHEVDDELDTGNIVLQQQIQLNRDSRIHELRAQNTIACFELTRMALLSLSTYGFLPSRKQISRGRYYSSMPSELKGLCEKKLKKYVSSL
jgi:folate-dependent phosphoribosylglycinamide formyltransferase PurN